MCNVFFPLREQYKLLFNLLPELLKSTFLNVYAFLLQQVIVNGSVGILYEKNYQTVFFPKIDNTLHHIKMDSTCPTHQGVSSEEGGGGSREEF